MIWVKEHGALCLEPRTQSTGFRVQSPGFRVQGSGFRVQGPGFRVQGSGFRVQGLRLGFRVTDSGSGSMTIYLRPSKRICAFVRHLDREVPHQHLMVRVWDLGFRVWSSGFRVKGLGFRV